ncbi:hypothetical protein D3C71_1725780 [compost metagenome]
MTSSGSSNGGDRTRIATSMFSASRSTRRLVSSRCTSTPRCSTMKSAIISPTRVSSKVTGHASLTMPRGSLRVCSMALWADSASTSIALQCVWKVCPISVTEKCRVDRWISRTPSRSSSIDTRRLSLDLGMSSARPAGANPPWSTTWAKK